MIYFVAGVVLITLAIQFYWNVKNYRSEKQRLVNDMQISLDQSVNNYFATVAKNSTIGLFKDSSTSSTGDISNFLDSIGKNMPSNGFSFKNLDSISIKRAPGIVILRGQKSVDSFQEINVKNFQIKNKTIDLVEIDESDSLKQYREDLLARMDRKQAIWDSLQKTIPRDQYFSQRAKKMNDSLFSDIPRRTEYSSIIITSKSDFIDVDIIDSLFSLDLERKNLNVDYGLKLTTNTEASQIVHPDFVDENFLKISSNSELLPDESELNLYFTNITATVLKRNMMGILLSTILMIAVIACLLFLLKIINRQKQLAEVKNDLISNITHEFKTPIATIGVALEGIESFNKANDPEKTKKYVQTSSVQLSKLNLMVEKLLETATLDSETLTLNKEEINLVDLLQNLIERHKALATDKQFDFSALRENVWITADVFHLENALNNVLDNAVKYGGNTIKTTLTTEKNQVILTIEDNGKNLTSAQAKQIFEKFYRVPKGNQHDVKGFGIGLYYTKKIIEGHQGTIAVALKNSTNFILTLPHG